jgi:hypothetical protein
MHDQLEADSRDARPSRSSGLTFIGLLVGAVMFAMLLGQLTGPDPAPRPPAAVASTNAPAPPATPPPDIPIGVDSIRECTVHLGGLTLGDHLRVPGSALERWDCDAPKGPRSLVIRADGGHFGVHGAVVTFPADQVGSGTRVAKPLGGLWDTSQQVLVWPLSGSNAQITGDLGRTELIDLALRITVEDGKPHLPALDGFSTAAVTPYRSPVVHEMRYSTDDLGEAGKRGSGLIYTGVTTGASFESLAFEAHAIPAGFVRGKPAIFSDVPSGNGALAWESAPGEVTYIGTEGMATRADAIETLRSLAETGRQLTPAQWDTKDRFTVAAPRG